MTFFTANMIAYIPDSIEFICSRFRPGEIQAEPAYQIERWAGGPSAETAAFVAAFREAQSRAKEHDCEVTFSAARIGTLTNHFCSATQDLFAITPDEAVSACYEVFDETNPRANIFVYGATGNEGAWQFDMGKLAFLRAHSVDSRDYCTGCFARWTCGGDCMHKAFTVCDDRGFSGTDRCNIIRELTEDQILARIGGIEDDEELYKQTEIVMLDDTSSGGLMSRRDFLGWGITAAATLAFLNGCGNPGEHWPRNAATKPSACRVFPTGNSFHVWRIWPISPNQ